MAGITIRWFSCVSHIFGGRPSEDEMSATATEKKCLHPNWISLDWAPHFLLFLALPGVVNSWESFLCLSQGLSTKNMFFKAFVTLTISRLLMFEKVHLYTSTRKYGWHFCLAISIVRVFQSKTLSSYGLSLVYLRVWPRSALDRPALQLSLRDVMYKGPLLPWFFLSNTGCFKKLSKKDWKKTSPSQHHVNSTRNSTTLW